LVGRSPPKYPQFPLGLVIPTINIFRGAVRCYLSRLFDVRDEKDSLVIPGKLSEILTERGNPVFDVDSLLEAHWSEHPGLRRKIVELGL
jgi:hypothetical protein